jgi:hypothetical protein
MLRGQAETICQVVDKLSTADHTNRLGIGFAEIIFLRIGI